MSQSNGNHTPAPQAAATRLRALLGDPDKVVVCPGVYDGFTARIALNEGFDALYMTGAGTAASRLGMADLGLATFQDMHTNASMLASLDRRVPVIADADTGYGGPLGVARTLSAYISAGVASLHLEDQVEAKRCGHLQHKELVSADTFVTRIRAAAMARRDMQAVWGAERGDIVLIARTDALQSLGFDEAVTRLKAAVAEGADVVFLEGFLSKDQGRQICQIMHPTPCLLNVVPGGVTPEISLAEAKEMGFKMIIYPLWALGPVYDVLTKAAQELKEGDGMQGSGKVGPGHGRVGIRDIFNICGMGSSMEFDAQAGGQSFAKGA